MLDIDHETTGPTLVSCLKQVGTFLVANPDHVPIAVLIETTTDPVPDDVRGAYDTLEQTVLTDVDADHAHVEDIGAAAAAGITAGYEDGSFRPGEPVPRGQMATFLWGALGED